MKKVVASLLVSTLAMGMFAGCGPASDTSSKKATETKKENKPEKLVLWEDKDKTKGVQPAVDAFTKKYGIKVEVKEVPMTDQTKKLALDGPAGVGADVITIPHDQIGASVEQGLLAPLTFDAAVTGRFTQASMDAQSYKGKLYGLPKSTESVVLVYNKKLINEADIPKTMEELQTQAIAKNKKDNYFFLAPWDNFYHAFGVMSSFGGYVFKNNNGALDPNDIGLNNDGAIKGADFIGKLYTSKAFPSGILGDKGGQTIDQLFTTGKLAIVQTGPWSFDPYKQAGIDIGVIPFPTLNGKPVSTFMGVKGYNVSSYSKNQDWAAKLVDFITNEESSKTRFETTQELAPIPTLIDSETVKADANAHAVAVQSQTAIPMPNIAEMGQVWAPEASALALIATGKQATKPALDDAVKKIKDGIAKTTK